MSPCAVGIGRGGMQPPEGYFAAFVPGRRGEILDAALGVFAEKGYEAGTMREIAAVLGVTEPALYRHYKGKEAILADIVSTAGDRIAEDVRGSLSGVTAENVVASLRAFIAMRRRSMAVVGAGTGGRVKAPEPLRSGAGGVIHALVHAAPHNATLIELMRAHLGRPIVDAVRELIPSVDAFYGIERTPAEAEDRVRVLMSLFAGYFSTSLLFDSPPNDDAIVDAVVAIMGWNAQG